MSILSSLLRDVAALFFSAALPCVRPDAGAGRAHGLYAVPGDGAPDGVLAPGRQPRAGAVPRHAARGAGVGAALLCPRQRVAGADPGFKYRGAWRTARAMGEWYGRCLKESGLYDDVEVVVPLPLHPVKRCRRGYNQSEYIAEGIAAQLGVEVDRRSVRRKRNTESQALKARRDRARNVEDAFAVVRPGRLAGRHVLLVDDVFTTGSTMLSCAGEILRSAPGCRISIAALAVSRHALGEKG